MSQDLLNKVYMEAMKLKNTSLSEIELKERLVNMGFPAEISGNAAKDILVERKKEAVAKGKKRITIGLGFIVLGLLIIVGSAVFLDTIVVLPIGIIFMGGIFVIFGLFGSSVK